MKETMKQHLHAAERKTIQSMIRREYDGWPPQSAAFFYHLALVSTTLPAMYKWSNSSPRMIKSS